VDASSYILNAFFFQGALLMNSTTSPTVMPPRRSCQRGEPTWEVALLFPAQGEWTENAYLTLDTNRLIELSDGCLEFLPMPTAFHQFIAQFLFKLLDAFVEANCAGFVLLAPLPVRLWPGKFREPDIVYVRRERLPKMHGQPQGADLAMEVVSEGAENRQRDLEIKRAEYAAAGISEYWIVDPEEQRITVLTLDGQTYRVHGEFVPGMQATSVLLPGFTVEVEAVFAVAKDVNADPGQA
jgi:Uma2 family endonuclease